MYVMYYDRQGKPISETLVWAKKFEDNSYKRIAETVLPDGKWVSTVWLGLNHRYDDGPPLIFETMVFQDKGHLDELDTAHYSTEEDALAGHAALVEKWSTPTEEAR